MKLKKLNTLGLVLSLLVSMTSFAVAQEPSNNSVYSLGVENTNTSLVNDTVVEAKLIASKKPSYPSVEKKLGIEGSVGMIWFIGKDGKLDSVQMVKSSGYRGIDKEAMKAAKKYKFTPAYRNGIPIPAAVRGTIDFTLSQADKDKAAKVKADAEVYKKKEAEKAAKKAKKVKNENPKSEQMKTTAAPKNLKDSSVAAAK